MSKIKKSKQSSTNKVSLEQAISRIKAYRSVIETKAFFISIDDIKSLYDEVVKLDGIGVRAYLAFNAALQEKELLLVGVIAGTDSKDFGKDLTDNVYDLTQPCPNMCDYSSVLYTLGETKSTRALRDLGKKRDNATSTNRKQKKA